MLTQAMSTSRMLTIIGCGTPNRRGDGAGVAVARRLLEQLGGAPPAGTRIFDAGASGAEVESLLARVRST